MKDRRHDIERYLRGELSPAEMHALEREALNDPFLAEALEGVEQAGADNFLYDLHHLNRSVHKRTRNRKNKPIKMWGWSAGMAAAVLLVAVSGFLVINLLNEQRRQQEALQAEAKSLMEMTSSRDTLTVVLPSEAIAHARDRKAPAPPSRGKARTNESPQTQTTPAGIAGLEDLPSEQNAQAEADDTGAITPETEAEVGQEPIALADTPDAEPSAIAEKAAEDETRSKKLDGRAARTDSRAPAVARSELSEVVLLKGKVTSATDGEALPGVNVTLKGTNIGTVTDGQGSYELPLPANNNTLIFSFIGFETHEVAVTGTEDLNVALEENAASLSEVVVTGYGAAHDRDKSITFRAAEPQGGKNDFKDYLNTSVKYPEEALTNKTEGRVTVRFTVEPNGQLTDFEVVRGIGSGCDEELVRAIREGPAWQPASRGDVPFRDKVKVRYKFALPE